MKWGLLLLGICGAAASLFACGSDRNGSRGASVVRPTSHVETPRPELAFFTTGSTGHSAIYKLGIADDRGEHLQVVTGESTRGAVFPQLFTGISWSPDGRWMAFAGAKGPQTDEHSETTDIYAIDADGSEIEQITEVGNASDPLWSPDGQTIVFTRASARFTGPSESFRGSLWSIGTDGDGLRQIAPADDLEIYSAGSFTRTSSRLAVTRGTLDPETGKLRLEIELMNPDGSRRRRLIDQASDPVFSPDGHRLAFASYRDRNGTLSYGDRTFYANELYVMNADGSGAKRLTETGALNEAHPSWLPDGSRLAYQRGKVFQNAEVTSIMQINPDGSCPRVIRTGSGYGPWYARPAWRPSQPRKGGRALKC
jgi:Tol biopolymer transport system component